MSNEAYKSAEQVALEGQGKPPIECAVQVEEPDITWGPYTVASSYEGCAEAWTYHRDQSQGRDGSPGGVDCTVRISPVPPVLQPETKA